MMSYEVGDKITVDSFVAGEVVDVTGTSKGKGYQGVIKRHGQRSVLKDMVQELIELLVQWDQSLQTELLQVKKLPGQMGHVTRTVQNLEVVAVDVENNLLLIKGSVPGPKKGLVIVKSGIKAAGKVNEAHELVDFTPVVEELKKQMQQLKHQLKQLNNLGKEDSICLQLKYITKKVLK